MLVYFNQMLVSSLLSNLNYSIKYCDGAFHKSACNFNPPHGPTVNSPLILNKFKVMGQRGIPMSNPCGNTHYPI